MYNLLIQSLSLIIHKLNDGIIITDLKGIIQQINIAAFQFAFHEYSKSQGVSINKLFKFISNQKEVLFNETTFTEVFEQHEIYCINKNNEQFLTSVESIKNEDKIIGYLVSINNPANKQNNLPLPTESEILYRESLEYASDIIYMTDKNGNFLHVNCATLKLLGYTEEEFLKLSVFNVIHPEYVNRLKLHYFRQYITKNPSTYLETPIVKKNGEKLWIGQNVNLIKKNGEITGFHAISRDITERKNTQEILRQNEEMLKMIINIIPDRIYLKDSNGKFLINNIAHLKALGAVKQEDVIGKTEFDFLNKAIAEKYKNQDLEVISSGVPLINFEAHKILPSGEDKWMLISKYPFNISDDKKTGIVGIGRDISAERKYEHQNTLLANALKSINECVTITDMEGNLIFVNKSFLKTYGYTENELIGKNISIVSSGKNPKNINDKILKETLNGGWKSELINVKKDGTKIPVFLSTTAIYDSSNVPFALIGVARDMTLRKKHEIEILKLNQAIVHSPVSIIITDLNGIIEYVNIKTTEMTGYPADELIGSRPNIFKSGFVSNATYRELWKTISSGKEWHGELYNRKKNGDLYWEYASISSIKNDDGKIINYIAFKDDITLIKNLEFGLKLAKEKAEKANILKDNFIANVSHEIRTPINGILGMTSIIKDVFADLITNEEEDYFSSIDRSSKRIIRTTELIINYSRFKVEDFPIAVKPVELSAIVEGVVREYKLIANNKIIDLIYENNSGRIDYESDSYCLYQIFSNIIDNAIKFTDNGFVKVLLSKPEENKIEFEVRDSGIGISEEYIAELFEPYTQEENGYTRSYDGIGLGLALTKLLIEKIGAEIKVTSTKGEGTTFIVVFYI